LAVEIKELVVDCRGVPTAESGDLRVSSGSTLMPRHDALTAAVDISYSRHQHLIRSLMVDASVVLQAGFSSSESRRTY